MIERRNIRPLILVLGMLLSVILFGACSPWYEGYDIASEQDLKRLSSVPELRKALKDPAPDVRANAAATLKAIGPDARDAVPDLMETLKDSEYAVRQEAANALAVMLPALEPERAQAVKIQVQITRLESKSWLVRRNAANSLAGIGRDAANAVPALILAILDDSDWGYHYREVRKAAARALGEIGFAARAANPALIETAKSDDYAVRLAAVKALGRIGPRSENQVIAALKNALDDPDYDVRREAAAALGRFGIEDNATVDELVRSLSDQDFDVRREAAISLGRLGPSSDETIKALVNALDDRDADVRAAVVSALGKVSERKQPQVMTAVLTAMDDQAEQVRLSAIGAIASIGIDNTGIASAYVMESLERAAHEDKSLKVKMAAAETLLRFKQEKARKLKHKKVSQQPTMPMVTVPNTQTAPKAAMQAVPEPSPTAAAADAAPALVSAAVSVLNVRATPTLNGRIVGKLYESETATVLESRPEWVKIKKPDGTQGYVYKEYTKAQKGQRPVQKAEKLVTPTVSTLNVRAAPDTNARIVTRLRNDETAEVVRTLTDWIKIKKPDGTTGFVYKSYTEPVSY
ncbi:MAG: HEAT repeat domain-containing protein [Thermodesulfobacteriota bacterium]|nr:HEAT repeat domain-containing protein [Thermodesulfobacteriota bacterium]